MHLPCSEQFWPSDHLSEAWTQLLHHHAVHPDCVVAVVGTCVSLSGSDHHDPGWCSPTVVAADVEVADVADAAAAAAAVTAAAADAPDVHHPQQCLHEPVVQCVDHSPG